MGSMGVFIVLIVSSASMVLIRTQFRGGKWLEHITLIDLSKHDRAGIARIASITMFAIALCLSAAATLVLWSRMSTVLFGLLVTVVLICLFGYISMARVPKVAA